MIRRLTSDQLGLKMVLMSLAISTLLSGVAAALQLYSSYQRQKSDLFQVVRQVEKALVPTLEAALWRFDLSQIDLILDSIVSAEGVTYVSLTPLMGTEMVRGAPVKADLMDEIPLNFDTPDGRVENLGSLRIEANLQNIRSRIWAQFRTLLWSNLIKAYIAATCLLILFYFLVTRHLRTIGNHIRETDWLHATKQPKLARRRPQRPDELENITDALGYAQTKVSSAVKDLEIEIETRKQAEERATRASKARKEFLATMSHEIRTPLNSIIGTFSLLRMSGISERQGEYVNNAENAARRLLGQLTNVLEISKLNAAGVKINYTHIDVRALAEDWLQTLKAQIHQHKKQVEAHLEIDPDMPVSATLDKTRLTQIVTNLTDNAVRFTESGHITISVDLVEGEDVFEVSVTDTGVGVPEESQSLIFDRFSQAEQGYKRGADGSGLGLSICAELCKLMDGSIQLQSPVEASTGSQFTVRLPIKELNEDEYFVPKTRSAG